MKIRFSTFKSTRVKARKEKKTLVGLAVKTKLTLIIKTMRVLSLGFETFQVIIGSYRKPKSLVSGHECTKKILKNNNKKI